jgi:beta-phosphoglucomutase family hydrolase
MYSPSNARSGGMTVAIDSDRYDAVIFDLDGVVTDTASLHCAAWKHLFDEYLGQRPQRDGESRAPFSDDDYRRYVDGKPRYDGVASFLAARGIHLPRGEPSDGENVETVCGLGNRKNRYFDARLAAGGVTVFDSTVALARQLQREGLRIAVFSSSRHCQAVLEAAGLGDLFPVRVDGVVAEELSLPGKPDPAILHEAARRLRVDPARCVVVEDAEAGVQAGDAAGSLSSSASIAPHTPTSYAGRVPMWSSLICPRRRYGVTAGYRSSKNNAPVGTRPRPRVLARSERKPPNMPVWHVRDHRIRRPIRRK